MYGYGSTLWIRLCVFDESTRPGKSFKWEFGFGFLREKKCDWHKNDALFWSWCRFLQTAMDHGNGGGEWGAVLHCYQDAVITELLIYWLVLSPIAFCICNDVCTVSSFQWVVDADGDDLGNFVYCTVLTSQPSPHHHHRIIEARARQGKGDEMYAPSH